MKLLRTLAQGYCWEASRKGAPYNYNFRRPVKGDFIPPFTISDISGDQLFDGNGGRLSLKLLHHPAAFLTLQLTGLAKMH